MAPLGAPASDGSGGDNICHFGGVRVRLTGSGSFRMSLLSQDDVATVTLGPFTMASATQYTPYRLCNMVTQNARFKAETTAIDEVFRVNRIIIYVKTLYTMIPG